MKLGDPELPAAQPIDVGGVARLYNAPSVGTSNVLTTFGGPSPMVGKVIKQQNANSVLGIEGGFGVNTAEAESFWGRPGNVLRKVIRIDKCPWPDGQKDIRIRCTFKYAQSVGGIPTTTSGMSIASFMWNRNTTFNFSMSASAPSNSFQEFYGFGGGTGGCSFELNARGVGAGMPLVQDDENPYTETFVTLDVTNPTWSYGDLFWYTAMTRNHKVPCPQWSIHHINLPGDADGFFEAASFANGPIGLIMSTSWGVEATGWDTGFDDDASYGQTVDVNGAPDFPNSYEFPDIPGSPYNIGVP